MTKKTFIATFTPQMKAKGYSARMTGRKEICISAWNSFKALASGAWAGILHLPATLRACVTGVPVGGTTWYLRGLLGRQIGIPFSPTWKALGYVALASCWIGIWTHLAKYM